MNQPGSKGHDRVRQTNSSKKFFFELLQSRRFSAKKKTGTKWEHTKDNRLRIGFLERGIFSSEAENLNEIIKLLVVCWHLELVMLSITAAARFLLENFLRHDVAIVAILIKIRL